MAVIKPYDFGVLNMISGKFFNMINLIISLVILVIIILGMAAILSDLFQHFRKSKTMTKSSIRWNMMLLLAGGLIIFDKVEQLFS